MKFTVFELALVCNKVNILSNINVKCEMCAFCIDDRNEYVFKCLSNIMLVMNFVAWCARAFCSENISISKRAMKWLCMNRDLLNEKRRNPSANKATIVRKPTQTSNQPECLINVQVHSQYMKHKIRSMSFVIHSQNLLHTYRDLYFPSSFCVYEHTHVHVHQSVKWLSHRISNIMLTVQTSTYIRAYLEKDL